MSQPLIAIVDDDDSLRTAIASLLRSFGFEAETFGSAEAFLEAANRPFAAIVTDIHMPGLSGFDLLDRLQRRGEPIPVVMITARTESNLEDRAEAAGACGFLRKPFDAERLVACLREVVTGG